MALIKRSDGSSQILNPDGTLYMHLPPAVPSTADLTGYRVRTITSGSHRCGMTSGTRSSLTDEMMSERELLRLVATLKGYYGAPSVSAVSMGQGSRTFRWAWEETAARHRVTDVVIATRV